MDLTNITRESLSKSLNDMYVSAYSHVETACFFCQIKITVNHEINNKNIDICKNPFCIYKYEEMFKKVGKVSNSGTTSTTTLCPISPINESYIREIEQLELFNLCTICNSKFTIDQMISKTNYKTCDDSKCLNEYNVRQMCWN
jgi:hypothetical protein